MMQDKYDYFMLAYDSPSFSAAAGKVPMSPQGFAKAIRNLEREGVHPPEIVKYSEIFWIYEFVLRGEGIGFTLPHLASLEVFSGSDAVTVVPAQGFTWGFGVSHLKAHTLGPREEDLIAYLDRRAAQLRRV